MQFNGRNIDRYTRVVRKIMRQSLFFNFGRRSIFDDSSVTLNVRRAIQDDGRRTVREVSVICDIGKTTAHKVLTEQLNMERVCERWVPRVLTDEDRTKRVAASQAFLRKWRSSGERFLDRIITTDETWLYYYDPETKQQSSQWVTKGQGPPEKARVCKSAGKIMCVMFMDRKGILLTHFVPQGKTVNAAYYSKVVCRDLVNAIRKKRPEKAYQLENVLFHQDNAPLHKAASTQLELNLLGFDQITHAPYSPDLAPMDFAIFLCIKADLKGLRFCDSQEACIACCEETRQSLVPFGV